MLNDVKPPPLESRTASPAARPSAPTSPARERAPARSAPTSLDRAHQLDHEAGRHTSGIDLVYSNPEDRGDSFNTMLSAVIVSIVVVGVGVMAAVVFF